MYLITGSTGNIGRGVVELLREEGHDVRALVRDASRAQLLPDGIDIAEVVSHIARDAELHISKTCWLTGPQLLTYSDVAATLSNVLHRPITFQPRTCNEDKQAMITAGLPEPIAEQNAQAFSLIATGDAAWLSDDISTILGHVGRTFEQFARDHAATFTA
jgi:uncharacterized protein YbjT (DUF2867 family)